MNTRVQENEFDGPLERQVERLKYYATRHGETLTHLSESQREHHERLAALEADRHQRDIYAVRTEEQYRHLERMIASLQGAIKEARDETKALKQLGGRALWVFISAIILAAAKWVLDGGLAG
jgi:chromosome segregation ATPase